MSESPQETSIPIGDWSVGSLKAYHDMMVSYERQVADERDRRYQERWAAQQTASEQLKEYQNEFRGALTDLSALQATKSELKALEKTLEDKIEANTSALGEIRSRLDVGNPALTSIQQQIAVRDGLTQDKQVTLGKIYAAIGAAVAVIGLVVLLVNQVFG